MGKKTINIEESYYKSLLNKEYVPTDLIFSTLLPSNEYAERLAIFIKENGIFGNILWSQVKEIDKKLYSDLKIFIDQNSKRIFEKYNYAGGDKFKLEMRKLAKNNKDLKTEIKSKTKEKTDIPEKKKKVNTQKQKEVLAKELLKLDINTLSLLQIKSIITYGCLEFKDLEPFYNKLNELKNKPKNYNKPNPIKIAKGLLTFNFSGKSNPMKWVEYDEIIMSKLYSAKMGLQYLSKNDKNAHKEVLKKCEENLNKVLEKLNFKSLNDIKF